MTLNELKHALEVLTPYANGDYCFDASHDELQMHLAKKPPVEVIEDLSWISWPWYEDNEDGITYENFDIEDDGLTITMFT